MTAQVKTDDPQALAPATVGGLDGDRIAELVSDGGDLGDIREGVDGAGNGLDAALDHCLA